MTSLAWLGGECGLCGGTTLWRHRGTNAPWICGTCLPPEIEPREIDWCEAFSAHESIEQVLPAARTLDLAIVTIRRVQRLPTSLWQRGSLYWVDLAIGRCEFRFVLVRRDPFGRRSLALSERHPFARLDDEGRRVLASPSCRARIEAAVLREIAIEEFA